MAKENQTGKGIQKAHRIGNPMFKRLYTLKEAAQYLGRSYWSVRGLMLKGEISVVKDLECRKIYFDIKDLDAYVERNKSAYT
jgi:hypothetical protein